MTVDKRARQTVGSFFYLAYCRVMAGKQNYQILSLPYHVDLGIFRPT